SVAAPALVALALHHRQAGRTGAGRVATVPGESRGPPGQSSVHWERSPVRRASMRGHPPYGTSRAFARGAATISRHRAGELPQHVGHPPSANRRDPPSGQLAHQARKSPYASASHPASAARGRRGNSGRAGDHPQLDCPASPAPASQPTAASQAPQQESQTRALAQMTLRTVLRPNSGDAKLYERG
ncbi:hypothetical protein ACUXAV_006615, partial [Cupriavidus metallidurans]